MHRIDGIDETVQRFLRQQPAIGQIEAVNQRMRLFDVLQISAALHIGLPAQHPQVAHQNVV
jgi:hypothetical protein